MVAIPSSPPAPSSAPAAASHDATPERIRLLAENLDQRIATCSREIAEINLQTRILAMNAQIEAARAGAAGVSFSVVGREISALSQRTATTAEQLEVQTRGVVGELAGISRALGTSVRGTRLADLALTNIDLIDRNLYERSCDCRWWATDPGLVAALEQPSGATLAHAAKRMGVILSAYTVYFDIVLADHTGRIVANGRPEQYPESVGSACGEAAWFRSAWATASGDEFGFESAHVSKLAGGERVLAYSCKVCRGGEAKGEPLGVLAVIFRWDALADHIVRHTPVDPADKSRTRACITDDAGRLLADSGGRALVETLDFAERRTLFAQKKTFIETKLAGRRVLIAHAFSPGFETYATGWHSVVMQFEEK